MSDRDGTPEDHFFRVTAHILVQLVICWFPAESRRACQLLAKEWALNTNKQILSSLCDAT